MAPKTPPKSRTATRPSARTKDAAIDSPTLDSRLAASLDATLLLDGDDSGLLDDFNSGVHGLDLMDTPPPARGASKAAAKAKQGRTARPSWGPSAAVQRGAAAATTGAKGRMRLLEGIVDESASSLATDSQEASSTGATTTAGRRLGGMAPVAGAAGKARSRYSLFARPAYAAESTASQGANTAADDSLALAEGDEGDESFLLPRVPAPPPQDAQALAVSMGAGEESTAPGKAESKEETERQLKELRAMNETFEAHEDMLRGTVGQIEAFAARIGETDALLDVYIDLLRQTEQRKQLILDPNWRGATEDAESHALSLRLAEEETARLKAQAEAEAAEREAAIQRAQEKARLAAAAAAQGGGAARGGSARGGRGVTRGAATRGAATGTRGRGAAPTTSTRGTGIARARGSTVGGSSSTRGTGASSSGYGTVRSSGYGPAR